MNGHLVSIFSRRIERAQHLKIAHPFAAEILTFYERICAQQQIAVNAAEIVKMPKRVSDGSLRAMLEVDRVIPVGANLLRSLVADSPRPIAQSIEEFLRWSANRQATGLQRYVDEGGTDEYEEDSRVEFIARVLIDPFAQTLAAALTLPQGISPGNSCPNCHARPLVGVLRMEGDGGKRFLLCSFCGTEWEFRRLLCAYCGETHEQSLPVFVAEKLPHIRVEACDSCHHFLRTIDLTKDGNAIPVVDDLAAIPLGLWADEHGYQRIFTNLLGT